MLGDRQSRVGSKPEEMEEKKKKGVRGKKIKEIRRDRNVNRKQGNSAEYFLKN